MTGRYPITFWGAPPIRHTNEQRYKEIAEAGFTLVTPPLREPERQLNAGSYEANIRILDLCEQFGMKAIIEDSRMNLALEGKENWKIHLDGMVKDYQFHPALEGYYIFDEPDADMFEHLGGVNAYLQEIDPAHPGFMNLFPNYATAGQLGTPTYREYVDRYAREVRPALLSYDHYVLFHKDNAERHLEIADERERLIFESNMKDDRPGFFDNIELIREVANERQLPFKVIILLVAHGRYSSATEAELRWQVFLSLAYGASTISYFTYWTPFDEPVWNYRDAMVTWDGEITENYARVRDLNRELQLIGSLLLGHPSLAVYHVGEEKEQLTSFRPNDAIKEISGGSVAAGQFEGGYWLLVNKDYERPSEIALTLEEGVSAVRIDKRTGRETTVIQNDNSCHLTLQPGDAELLRMEGGGLIR